MSCKYENLCKYYELSERPSTERFIDNGDGTVTDTKTGLMWEKSGSGDSLNWLGANQYAEGLRLGGYADWRLPTIVELLTIVDYSKNDPCIDPIFKCGIFRYWTATSNIKYLDQAWCICFGYGNMNFNNKSSNYFRVRCTRTIAGEK